MKKIIFLVFMLTSLFPLSAKKAKKIDPEKSVAIPPARTTYTPAQAEETTQVSEIGTAPEQPATAPAAQTILDYVAPEDTPAPAEATEQSAPPAENTSASEPPAAETTATEPATTDAPLAEEAPAKTEADAQAAEAQKPIPVASKDEPVPQPEPYKSVYLLDYLELDSEDDKVPESAFNPNAGRYQFIENADARDAEGRTLLMKAARNGNISMLENLIYSEANVNATDSDGWTALMFAARFSNNPKAITLLLNAGANPQAENNYGITALLLAAGFSQNTQVVATLLEKRSIAEKEVLAAFIYAVTNEARADILQLFIEKGIAINAPYEGKTPLMYAAETNKSTGTIGWLLEHGARTRYKTTAGQTAYDFARANKRLPKDKIYWSLNTNGAAR